MILETENLTLRKKRKGYPKKGWRGDNIRKVTVNFGKPEEITKSP